MEQIKMLPQACSWNYRPKGFRVNKVFQAVLLLGMCIWLLNQIKHSGENKAKINDQNTPRKLSKEHADLLIAGKGTAGSHESVYGEFPSEMSEEAEQAFPGNELEIQRASIVGHDREADEMGMKRNFGNRKLKIEREVANNNDVLSLFMEEEHRESTATGTSEIAEQVDLDESGFQSFQDENGVPPELLNVENSNSFESTLVEKDRAMLL